MLKSFWSYSAMLRGTVIFSSEMTISLNFTAEHTENAKALENLIPVIALSWNKPFRGLRDVGRAHDV